LVVVQGPKPLARSRLRRPGRWGSRGRAEVSPWSRPVPKHRSWFQGAKAQGDGPGERSLLVRFPKGAKALWSWCTDETVRRGMQRGRAAGPLAKMARCHRAHLVFALNDLFSLLSGCKIREALTFPAALALRREPQFIPALRPVGQILVTRLTGARHALLRFRFGLGGGSGPRVAF
jgi:hypothetical protein